MIEIKGLEYLIPLEAIPNISDDMMLGLLEGIAESAYDKWGRLASKVLHTTRQDYIKAIQKPRMESGAAIVSLLGAWPHAIEEGLPAVNMRDTLLGPNVPTSSPGNRGKHENKAGGYYRSIPFRHRTPTAGRVSGGVAMGTSYKDHPAIASARKLGKEVYNAAKALSPTKSSPYDGVKYGGRLAAGMAPLLKPHHKTDIYAGMIRATKTYEKVTQGAYYTFRTISTTGGDPQSWQRPATPGIFLAKQVADFVEKIAPAAIDALLEGLGL